MDMAEEGNYQNSNDISVFTFKLKCLTYKTFSAWVTLGKPRSENPKTYIESGFQGHLTKVQIWNRALDVTGEIQKQVRDCRTEPVLYRGLILTWSGYDDTVGGVERIVPSHCGQRNCPPGYGGPKCQDLEVDKVNTPLETFHFVTNTNNIVLDSTKGRVLPR